MPQEGALNFVDGVTALCVAAVMEQYPPDMTLTKARFEAIVLALFDEVFPKILDGMTQAQFESFARLFMKEYWA